MTAPTTDPDRPLRTSPDSPVAAVAARVERETGRRLPPVVVDRTPAAATVLSSMGAQAAAVGGRVLLGPGGHSPAEEGLLAHELTHLVQQARGPVPPEDSPEGRVLEREARRAEARAGGRPEPAPERMAVPASTAVLELWSEGPGSERAAPSPMRQAAPAPAPAPTPRAGSAPATATATSSPTEQVQRATDDHVRRAPAPPARSEPARDVVDGLTAAQLDRLSGRIYERLRSRIRHELLVDRERSALLTDR